MQHTPPQGLAGMLHAMNDAHNFIRSAIDALQTLEHWLGQMKGGPPRVFREHTNGHGPHATRAILHARTRAVRTPLRPTRGPNKIPERNPRFSRDQMVESITYVLRQAKNTGLDARHVSENVAAHRGVSLQRFPDPNTFTRLVTWYLTESKFGKQYITRTKAQIAPGQRGAQTRYVYTLRRTPPTHSALPQVTP